MTVLVGTSGWQYASWRGSFYPAGLPPKLELEWFAERFRTVEVNNTFYRLPEAHTFRAWAERTPDDFVLAIKASRFLTHVKRLKDPGPAAELLLSRALAMGAKLGPILLQLPPTMQRDDARLEQALEAFPPPLRVTVEPRHASWFVEPVRALLERHGAALCLADRGSRWITPLWRTADWGFVRFHAGRATPEPCYGPDALMSRARTLAELFGDEPDLYAYFNNDPRACAPRDARRFARACELAGLTATRRPRADETKLC